MQASVTDLRNELHCSLTTNMLQHRTMTLFSTTAGKVTQDHELPKTHTYTLNQACTSPLCPWLDYLHQVGEPKPIFSRFLVTVTTLPLGESAGKSLLLCAALL